MLLLRHLEGLEHRNRWLTWLDENQEATEKKIQEYSFSRVGWFENVCPWRSQRPSESRGYCIHNPIINNNSPESYTLGSQTNGKNGDYIWLEAESIIKKRLKKLGKTTIQRQIWQKQIKLWWIMKHCSNASFKALN